AARRRRWGNRRGQRGTLILNRGDKRKKEVREAREPKGPPCSQLQKAIRPKRLESQHRHRSTRKPGVHDVSHHTTGQKTRESETASPPHNSGASRTGLPPGTASRGGPPTSPR